MYLEHFGIEELPFSLTPNPRFFLGIASYQKTFNVLMGGIASWKGIIKVIGEAGTGKTMLCRKVLNSLEENSAAYVTAWIANPVLSPKGLLLAFAAEIGLEEDADSGHHSLLKKITGQLMRLSQEGKQVVLLVDGAHTMPEKTLEALHLLTILGIDKFKRFQVILFATPELDTMLSQPSLRKLLRGITCSCRLEPLNRGGVEQYVAYRLHTAGYNGPALLGRRALDVLYQSSQGIPRVINILCHKALMVAYGRGEHSVDAEHVRRAVEDTEGVSVAAPSCSSVSFAGVALVAGVVLVAYLISYYNGHVL